MKAVDGAKLKEVVKILNAAVYEVEGEGDVAFLENKIKVVGVSVEKIAEAFGFPYFSAHTNDEMRIAVDSALVSDSYTFCEIFTDTQQVWEPKSSAKRLGDGSLVSPPLEDLSPFLPREEVLDNLYIKPVE